jgi:hypothetical protein
MSAQPFLVRVAVKSRWTHPRTVFARRRGDIIIPAANVTLLDKSGDPTGTALGQSLTLHVILPAGLDMSGPVLAATKVTASETWTPDPATASFRPGGAVSWSSRATPTAFPRSAWRSSPSPSLQRPSELHLASRRTQRKPTWLVEVSTGSACRAAGR